MGKTWRGKRRQDRGQRSHFHSPGGNWNRPVLSGPPPMPDAPSGLPSSAPPAAAPVMGAPAAEAGGKKIRCIDCGTDFLFSESEQAFYRSRKLSEPKRCEPCRAKKRAERQRGQPMGR